jgi:serine/threonine-protein phosphatase 2B catalytic subunit
MLLAILKTCSKEELEDDDLILNISGDYPSDQTTTTAISEATVISPTEEKPEVSSPKEPEGEKSVMSEKEASRSRIRQKILAVGRISRVFAVLREESERVSELKDLMGTTKLPYGYLALGAEGLKKAIHSFEDAKKSDIDNERLPPTKEEKEKEEKDKILKALDEAQHTSQSRLEELEAMKMAEASNDS